MLKSSKVILILWILSWVMFWGLCFLEGYSVETIPNILIYPAIITFIPVMLATCIIHFVTNLIKKKNVGKFAIFFFLTLFILVLLKITIQRPSIIGASLSLKNAGEKNVIQDVMNILENNSFKKLEIIPMREKEIENILPGSFKKLNASYFVVFDKGIYFKKIGIGDSEGFYITPTNVSPGGIKLTKGIYWISGELLTKLSHPDRDELRIGDELTN